MLLTVRPGSGIGCWSLELPEGFAGLKYSKNSDLSLGFATYVFLAYFIIYL